MKNFILLLFLFLTKFNSFGQKIEFYFGAGKLALPSANSIVRYNDLNLKTYIYKDAATFQSKFQYNAGIFLRKPLSSKIDFLFGLDANYKTFNTVSVISSTVNTNFIDIGEIFNYQNVIGGIQYGTPKKITIHNENTSSLQGTNYTVVDLGIPASVRLNKRNYSLALGVKASYAIYLKRYSEQETLTFVSETATERIYNAKIVPTTRYKSTRVNPFGLKTFLTYTAWINAHVGLGIEAQTQLNGFWLPPTPDNPNIKNFTSTPYKVHPRNLDIKLYFKL